MEEKDILGSVSIPGGGTMTLTRQGRRHTIWVDDTELMNDLVHESEDALAQLACAKLLHVEAPVILIGGLGMGFTLAAALNGAGSKARVIVAELVPMVVEWNRGPLSGLAGHPLKDARVSLRPADVRLAIQAAKAEFDAILLDVDNGPAGLTRGSNDWLYTEEGLAAAYRALKAGGVLAVWSAQPDKGFTMRLCKLGFAMEEVRVPSGGGERNTIWLALTPPAQVGSLKP